MRPRLLPARVVIRLVGIAAPISARSRFVREWEAELWHEFERGRSSLGLVSAAAGSVADVVELRRLDRITTRKEAMRRWTDGWAREFRQASRALLRRPGFTAVSVITLGLGMGGATGIFTLLDRIVLDPLPYPAADRLVRLQNQVPGVAPDAVWNMSTAQFVHLREQPTRFEQVGIYRGTVPNLQTPEGPRRVFGWRVSASILDLIGAEVTAGRLFDESDDQPGAPPVALISARFRRQNYPSSNPVGQELRLDDQPVEIIGVLGERARMPDGPLGEPGDVWLPLRIDPSGEFRSSHLYPMIARLLPTATPEQAEADLEGLTARLPDRFPRAYGPGFFERYGFRTHVVPLKQDVVGSAGRNLWLLFGAVGLVLLMATANVANLFLARLELRQRDLSIRSALGAGRRELARHLLAEGLVVAGLGGLVGLLVAYRGVPAMVSIAPDALPRVHEIGADATTVVFALLLSILVALGLAAYPVLRRTPEELRGGLGSETRGAGGTRTHNRIRSGLIVVQMALAVILIVGAGLLLQTMWKLTQMTGGVEPEGRIAVTLSSSPGRYADPGAFWTVYREILSEVRAIPGVRQAGMASSLPVESGFGCTVQAFADRRVYERVEASGGTTCAGQTVTAPGFFEAAGIPLLEGRALTDADNDSPSRGAVVVSRAFAHRFWPNESALGKRIAPSGRTDGPFYRVVGVVEDVAAGAVDGERAIAVYYPVVSQPDGSTTWGGWDPSYIHLVIHADAADPAALVPEVRRRVARVDPAMPASDPRTFDGILSSSRARARFTATLVGFAALCGLILAAVGLYGVVSYVVSRRTREIGMRIALGASPRKLEGRFVAKSLALALLGAGVGLLGALAGTRVMRGLLVGVEPTDPISFVAALGVLLLVVVVASWIPARRAARVDPMEALRAE